MQFQSGKNLVNYDCKSKKIILNILVDEKAENPEYCHENKKVAYTIDNNLYIIHGDKKITPVTSDKDKGIVNGQTVHRNEFGISDGIFWSPKGNYLAFYKKDETMVTDYPLVDMTKRIAEIKNIKYPMAGMKSEEVKTCVYDIQTGKTTVLQTGEPVEQYLTNISWSQDEQYIFIAVLNREQNYLKFNQYDIKTGNFIKTIFEEENFRYVEPEIPALFLPGNPDLFIWKSERDGWDHLYLYSIKDGLKKQLTKGEWVVTEVLGFDSEGKNLFFMSTKESPLENHGYKIDIETGKITRLTSVAGTHNATLSPTGNFLIDNYNSTKDAKVFDIIDSSGDNVKSLLKSKNPLIDYSLGELKIGSIKADDNQTDLYYRLIKPLDFDPNKKYPAIIYVYGGPHAQLVTNSWQGGARLWEFYMAQNGYVMITIDNRGSSNRGFEFESCIHRNLGDIELRDQLKAVEVLKGLGYVDTSKIGVHGWSYGGFLTTSLMLKHSDIFKVGVAGGPVMDWKYYEVMYGERYMDMPVENPQGYENACLTTKTDDLKGKLLIIHGYIDNTVVLQHSLDFIENCIKNNKQVDFFVYPTAEHNVFGYDRIHLMQKVSDYFDANLK
ncbi:MAG: DPP IV N-terminal domain-containing protein [Bacteroidota bacterium]